MNAVRVVGILDGEVLEEFVKVDVLYSVDFNGRCLFDARRDK